ncbi:MAG: prohibitin family protein [Clostridiales bacterium]|nr:prohibitin family protein [Clostridiales bacterium]
MKKVIAWIVISLVLLAGVIIGISSFTTVPVGEVGVASVYGKVIPDIIEPGLHGKNPFAKVITISVKEQKAMLETSAFSRDIQQVDVKLSVNFSVNKANVVSMYKEVGTGYYDVLVLPRILESIKMSFSKYSAEELVANRSELSASFKEILTASVNATYITIIQVSIEDIDFTDAYTDAVEAKQVAEQTKLRIETEAATDVARARAEAEKITISAAAEAERIALESQAEANAILTIARAQAEANALLSASLTPELLQYEYYKAWDGKLPTHYYGNPGNNMLIMLPE